MSEENKILIFLFLSVVFIYLIGFVFLRWRLRKKYKFPTQIPSPFFGVKEFSAFLKGRARSGEPCHKRTGRQGELVPPVRNGHFPLIINNFRSRTELVLTAEEDLDDELKIVDVDNQSICDGEVGSTLQQSSSEIREDSLCVQIEGLSENNKGCETFDHITNIDFKGRIGLAQENNQDTGEMYQVCKDLTIPEVLTHCSSGSKLIGQKNAEEEVDLCTNHKDLQITDHLHHKLTKGITPKENSKQNPQKFKNKKKKMVKGQWILKKWQKKQPQSEADLPSSVGKVESVQLQYEQEMPENVAKEKVLLKDCKHPSKHSGNEEVKRQYESPVVRNSTNKNEQQSSLEDDTESLQNYHEEEISNQLFSVKHKILQSEQEQNELEENSKWKDTPMLLLDREEFLQENQAEKCPEILSIDECENRSGKEQETFLILQKSKVEHDVLPLMVKEDNISQISNSTNNESFVSCRFSYTKDDLKFSENHENGKPEIVNIDDNNCYPLDLSLRKHEEFPPHFIGQTQSSEENDILKESNSVEAKFVTTKLEHESALKIDNQLNENQSALKIDNQLIENQSALKIDHQLIENRSALKIENQLIENRSALKIDNQLIGNQSALKIDHQLIENQSVLKIDNQLIEHESALKIDNQLIENQSVLKIDNQLFENSKSTDDDGNQSLKSKQSEVAQFSFQNISFTTNNNQKSTAQFPNQRTDVEIDSLFRDSLPVNKFIPAECKVSNIDFGFEATKKSKKEENFVSKPFDGIKYLDQMLVPEIYHQQQHQQQRDEDSYPLDCRLIKVSDIQNYTYSDQKNLLTNILIPEELNTSTVTKNSNSSNYNQNMQTIFSTSKDDQTLHQKVFPQNNCLQEQFLFSSNSQNSEKLTQPKPTHLPFDYGSKQILNSKSEISTEKEKMVADLEDDFGTFSENSFSGITSQEDLRNGLFTFQPINHFNNADNLTGHELCVNIAEELNQISLDKRMEKTELFKISISSEIDMHEDISKIEELTPESSTDVISHSKDKPGETRNPEVVKYITRSVKSVLVLTEDVVSEKFEQESKCNQCLAEDENSTTNSLKFPDDFKMKPAPSTTSSAHRMPQDRISKDTRTKEQSGKDPTISDNVPRISGTEEFIPEVQQTHKTLRNNAQSNERIPSPKQVHWLPGYVCSSPILSDLNHTKPVNSLAIQPIKENGTPRNGILKSRYRSYHYNDQNNSSELETSLTTFEDAKLYPRIAPTSQDCCQRDESFLYSSQCDYPQGGTRYSNDYYQNPKYTENIDNHEPTYIYSVQSNPSESPAMRDEYYSESNHSFTANKLISGSETPSFDSKELESFTYENTSSKNEKLKPSSNSLNLEFDQKDDSYVDQSLKSCGNKTSLWEQRDSRDDHRACRSSSFYEGRHFSPLRNLGRFDTHPPSPRYSNHFKSVYGHSTPNYYTYADDEYKYWSYRRYQHYLNQLWYREHYWNDYLQRYAHPRHQHGYREWYSRRWWEDYVRYKERYWDYYWWVHQDSLRYKDYWEHSPSEYSTSDDKKRYLDIPKPNKEQSYDKHEYAEADDKDKRIEERGEYLLDYRPAVRYKERNDRNAFRAQDKWRTESHRHQENFLEERPWHPSMQNPRELFHLPGKREGYKEDYLVTDSNEYAYEYLQGSPTYHKDDPYRERYHDHFYKPRYREGYRHDCPAVRSSERHATDFPIDE